MTAELTRVARPLLGADGRSATSEPTRIRRILVVDDDDGFRASLAAFLEAKGYEVAPAADGAVARTLLDTRPFDLVLTDISMPEISGLDLLEEVKTKDVSIEVILITGYLDITWAIQAMRKGAYDFFTKPFSFDKLLLTIARVDEKRQFQEQARRYEILKRQKEFEDQATLETTLGLARAVEERDKYNIGHGKRTANYAVMLGRRLGFDDEHLRALRFAGLLHDVGKIGIDDKILNKPDRLDPHEMESIRRHPEIGEYILTPISFLRTLAPAVRSHHERFDGRGYPDGLAGDQIPLDARVLCIADYFDSITSARPYRRPMPLADALALMKSERGRHFDPELAELFLQELDRSALPA